MNTGFINVIVDEWCEMTNIVLDLKELSFSKIQNLLKGTYEILTEYHKEKLIPKEISKLLLEVDSFLYFTSLMEENEKGVDFYHFQYISSIFEAMKKGFFNSEYTHAFPELKISDIKNNEHIINFETDIFT